MRAPERPRPESNRGARICSPLANFATTAKKHWLVWHLLPCAQKSPLLQTVTKRVQMTCFRCSESHGADSTAVETVTLWVASFLQSCVLSGTARTSSRPVLVWRATNKFWRVRAANVRGAPSAGAPAALARQLPWPRQSGGGRPFGRGFAVSDRAVRHLPAIE